MPTLTALKARFQPGSEWDVTNHYVDNPNHPAYGTTRRRVLRTTSGGVYLAYTGGGGVSRVDWPKASQVTADGESVTFSNHPHRLGDPFLTFTPAKDSP